MPLDGELSIGPFSASSYAQISDADAYFAGRLNSDSWDNASSTDRYKSLVQSTRAIDRLRFAGVKTNIYNWITQSGCHSNLNDISIPSQALEFPRNGLTAIPIEIVQACCENALTLLDGVDAEQEAVALNIESLGFSELREHTNRHFTVEHIRAGIVSVTAWNYLKPFLSDPNEIKLTKV